MIVDLDRRIYSAIELDQLVTLFVEVLRDKLNNGLVNPTTLHGIDETLASNSSKSSENQMILYEV